MKLGLYLEVKFRALGITFGTLRQNFMVGPVPPFLVPDSGSGPAPDAQGVFDSRGVKLYVWVA